MIQASLEDQKNRGRPIKISVPRFQQERCFAWFQRKYRGIVVRWERIFTCLNAFLSLATIHIWINRIILVGRFWENRQILRVDKSL